MIDFFTSLIEPIEWLVAWIMYGFHSLFVALGMPSANGWTWTLSIVGLVVVQVLRAIVCRLLVLLLTLLGLANVVSKLVVKVVHGVSSVVFPFRSSRDND